MRVKLSVCPSIRDRNCFALNTDVLEINKEMLIKISTNSLTVLSTHCDPVNTYIKMRSWLYLVQMFVLENIVKRKIGIDTENQELSWCQLFRLWWHHRLSLWQPRVPQLTKSTPWQPSNSLVALRWRHMNVIKSQITGHSNVCLTAYADPHQSPRYLPFVMGIHRWPMNSSHKGPVTRKNLPFDDVIME